MIFLRLYDIYVSTQFHLTTREEKTLLLLMLMLLLLLLLLLLLVVVVVVVSPVVECFHCDAFALDLNEGGRDEAHRKQGGSVCALEGRLRHDQHLGLLQANHGIPPSLLAPRLE